MVAKEGFGPDGRKKLKNAGVPTNFPSNGEPGQFRVPRTSETITFTPQVPGPLAPGANEAGGATTVTGFVNPNPATSAFRRLLASSSGSVELMSTGRLSFTPWVYW